MKSSTGISPISYEREKRESMSCFSESRIRSGPAAVTGNENYNATVFLQEDGKE
jgi:hypothetical protein